MKKNANDDMMASEGGNAGEKDVSPARSHNRSAGNEWRYVRVVDIAASAQAGGGRSIASTFRSAAL